MVNRGLAEHIPFIANTETDIVPQHVEDALFFIGDHNQSHAPDTFFHDVDPEKRSHYLAFMFNHVLDDRSVLNDPAADRPGERLATIYATYGLTTVGGEEDAHEWANLFEHISGSTAAGLTVARRMQAGGAGVDLQVVKDGLLLHDATKRGEKVRHGALYNDVTITERSLGQTLAATHYPQSKLEVVVTAAENTNRAALLVPGSDPAEQNYLRMGGMTPEARYQYFREHKSLEQLIVGYADARSLGHHFAAVEEARDDYLANPRKQDPASQLFFREVWAPYWQAVGDYLEARAPGLNLAAIDDELIYRETIRPDALGVSRHEGYAEPMTQHHETNEAVRLPVFRMVEEYTKGKSSERNEDAYKTGPDRLILSDGATDKNGFRHAGKTGGELAAQAVVAACQASDTYGKELVDAATAAIHEQYEAYNQAALTDSAYRYSATLLDARVIAAETTGEPMLVITRVGDSGIRVTRQDGTSTLLYETKLVDAENAALRAAYIREHPDDIEGGRTVIMDRLREQHRLQNVPLAQNAHGYGVIDGTPVPDEFIKIYRFPAGQVRSVELFSDGYGVVPEETDLAAFEVELARQNELDPHRIGEAGFPPQTKTNDDRTYLLAKLR